MFTANRNVRPPCVRMINGPVFINAAAPELAALFIDAARPLRHKCLRQQTVAAKRGHSTDSAPRNRFADYDASVERLVILPDRLSR